MHKTHRLLASLALVGCFHATDDVDASTTSVGDDVETDTTDASDTTDVSDTTGTTDTTDISEGETFECSSGLEIPIALACDGVADCADNSDEVTGCGLPAHTCADNWEIPLARFCDGIADCVDAEDESNCSGPCGWNSANSYYDCGFAGADPEGNHSIVCPMGMANGDPCAVSGLTGEGCCDAVGNNWYCADGNLVYLNECMLP